MNKRTKISLILAVTVLLVILSVGLASGAAPMPVTSLNCFIAWMGVDKDGVEQAYVVFGETEWTLDENIITKTCAGNIPLGEFLYNHSYFDLDEMRAYLEETYGADIGDSFVIGPEETGDKQMTISYKGDSYKSYDWTAYVNTNGDFEYTAYFNIE